jgi:CheY-like chemotaxis protein
MNTLLILAAIWAGLFFLALALVSINSRVRVPEPTWLETQPNPFSLTEHPEQLDTLRDVIASKVVSSTPAQRRAKRIAGDKQRIFVVDDDPDILKLIEHVLDIEGFDVRSFTDPNEALAAFNSGATRPEMVVTDFCMQPMNGLELISRCRLTAPNLKSVVISGMVDENSISKMHEKTDGFIAKPFKVANLVQTLNDTLAEVRN